MGFKTIQLTPAEYVIEVFGGVREASRAIGRSPSAVSRWQTSKDRGGCDGGIPRVAQNLILKVAKLRGDIDITSSDLLEGRKIRRKA